MSRPFRKAPITKRTHFPGPSAPHVAYAATDLPVLHTADIAVIGGAFAGVSAALTLARAGRRVVLVEPRTYLGREVTATLRPWFCIPEPTQALPEAIGACLPKTPTAHPAPGGPQSGRAASREPTSPGQGAAASRASAASHDAPPTPSERQDLIERHAADGEIPLRMEEVKLRLEDLLLDAGVRIVYASLPVGLHVEGGRLRGVVIGNKSGRQVIACDTAIDATATALVARLASARFVDPPPSAVFSAALEFTGVGELEGRTLSVPQDLGLVDDRLTVHRGLGAPGHVILTYDLDLAFEGDDPLASARRDAVARRVTATLAEYLVNEVSAFDGANPAGSAYELQGPHARPMLGPLPAWVGGDSAPEAPIDSRGYPEHLPTSLGGEGFRAAYRGLPNSSATADPLAAFASPLPGLWCLNEAARLDEPIRTQLRDPVAASRIGEALATRLLDSRMPDSPADEVATPGPHETDVGSSPELRVSEADAPRRGVEVERVPIAGAPIPVLKAADVLVVGGGTSGAIAGLVAAREGMSTVVVDMNPGLGGTATYGGINTYWFGQRRGFAERMLERVGDRHARLGLARPEGELATWNVQVKVWELADALEQAGATVLTGALAVGTLVEGEAVRGVVAATPTGPVALLGAVTIDATGDGDVAAFAAAPSVYGSEREHSVMYAYMPQVPEPGRPRNVKTGMVDVGDIQDVTRMVMAERRRRQPGDYDHGPYLAPRESRHVLGEVVLTLTDELARRAWSDVVLVAFSNYDMKGEPTSDWITMGIQPPNLEIEIPYRALIPRSLDNLLVAGKAYSATHDALAAPRMQRDMENLGGVVALAASMAVRNGISPRDVDVRALQTRLVAEDVLPERVLTRTLIPLDTSMEALTARIEALETEISWHAYADLDVGERYVGRVAPVDIMVAGPHVTPILEAALQRASGVRRLRLAQMLAVLGSTAGVPALVEAIQDHLSAGELPARQTHVRHVGYPPNQGAAPFTAHLLYALGAARDPRSLPVWRRVVDLLRSTTREDLFDPVRAHYYYAAAVCQGAERLGDPAAVPILKRLHSGELFRGHVVPEGLQIDYLAERLAWLELALGRALARCGAPEGYVVLIDYLRDVRALVADAAHVELMAVSGQSLLKDVSAWTDWLETHADALRPMPWTRPTDPVLAWQEEILTEARP